MLFLLTAVIIVFRWYTIQNKERIENQNKNYAADSVRQTAAKIDEELNNAQDLINTYTYFLEESLTDSTVTAQKLKEIEKNSQFDAVIFTDINGKDYTSDGRTSDVTQRDFYINGLRGESGISPIFDSYFFDGIMVNFYAPVRSKGEIIGVLRGAYLAEKYLKDMLITTYFGEEADVDRKSVV